jgi:hypothetical protein
MTKQVRIPNLIKDILKGKELETRQIYYKLMDALAETGKGTKSWRNTPSKQQVVSILSSGLHPFIRVNGKKQYPAVWTYYGEEE